MLVIWRRAGESFTMDETEIEVLESRTGKVKLGVRAPEAVTIIRGESRPTRQENEKAATMDLLAIANLLSGLPR